MPTRSTIPLATLWIPIGLLALLAAVDLGWLALQRQVLHTQTHRACLQGALSADPQDAAWQVLVAGLASGAQACPGCGIIALPVADDGALYCEAELSFTPLIGLLTRPHTLQSHCTVPRPG